MYSFKEKTERSFFEIDCRFNAVDGRLDRVENRLDKVEIKLDSLVSLYKNHDTRIVKLEKSMFPKAA